MKHFYVYAHFTEVGDLFYIGKGKNNRAFSNKGRSKYWKRVKNKHGIKIEIIEKDISEEEAFILEMMFIEVLNPRCNFTKGGSGGCTWVKYSEEEKTKTLKKCSEARKKWWNSKDKNYKKKHLEKLVQGVKNYWKSFTKEELSKEQKRRNSFKTPRKILCLNNNTIYKSSKEAANALNIKYSEHVQRVANGNRAHCKGLKFQYVI